MARRSRLFSSLCTTFHEEILSPILKNGRVRIRNTTKKMLYKEPRQQLSGFQPVKNQQHQSGLPLAQTKENFKLRPRGVRPNLNHQRPAPAQFRADQSSLLPPRGRAGECDNPTAKSTLTCCRKSGGEGAPDRPELKLGIGDEVGEDRTDGGPACPGRRTRRASFGGLGLGINVDSASCFIGGKLKC